MSPRQPVFGDDLRKRGLAQHQFRQPRRGRIDRHRLKRRRRRRQIDHHDPGIARNQACQRQRGQRDTFVGGGAEHGDLARGVAGAAQVVGEPLHFGEFGHDAGRLDSERLADRRSCCGLNFDFGFGFEFRLGGPGGRGACADCSGRGGEHRHRARRRHAQQFARDDRAGGQHQGGQRRDQHDRQLLRIGWGVGDAGAGNDAAVGRRRLDVLAGVGLAVFCQIGFQQVALRLGLALERAQLHVLGVGRTRLLLHLLQAGAEAFDPAAGDPCVAVERTRQLAGFLAELAVEIIELRLQFLDARMVVEQGRGLLGELRAQRDALFGQPPRQFGIQHLGSLDRLAALEHFTNQPRLRFGIGFQRARIVQLRVELAHLLVRQRGVVGADEQAGFRAEILDPGFGLADLLAQAVDLARQPQAGGFGLLLPRILLQHQIAIGDRIGDARRQFRVPRLEFDDDDARLVDRIGGEAIVIGVEHALFGGQ